MHIRLHLQMYFHLRFCTNIIDASSGACCLVAIECLFLSWPGKSCTRSSIIFLLEVVVRCLSNSSVVPGLVFGSNLCCCSFLHCQQFIVDVCWMRAGVVTTWNSSWSLSWKWCRLQHQWGEYNKILEHTFRMFCQFFTFQTEPISQTTHDYSFTNWKIVFTVQRIQLIISNNVSIFWHFLLR